MPAARITKKAAATEILLKTWRRESAPRQCSTVTAQIQPECSVSQACPAYG